MNLIEPPILRWESSVSSLARPLESHFTGSSFLDRRDAAMHEQWCEAWNRLMDQRLIEWGRNPAALEDDRISAPSAIALSRAYDVAKLLRNHCQPPPTTIVPTGDGGIALVRRDANTESVLELDADGELEFYAIRDGKLVERRRI